ncbi:MAG: Maf family protein [Clostridiales bacterium]|nr:Maf family protein [Clostridiales bacterium]
MRRLILASASPRRSALLRQVGFDPVIEPSHVQEVMRGSTPSEVVQELSRQKASDIAALHRGEDMVVLGADTVVAADGRILGKPGDEEEAVSMLSLLQGRDHQVYTGVTMIDCAGDGCLLTFAEKTDVHFYPMTEAQIRDYVATGDPMDKAGAYGIQGRFAAWVRGIEGDYNNVVGLPVARICQELLRHGSEPSAWKAISG